MQAPSLHQQHQLCLLPTHKLGKVLAKLASKLCYQHFIANDPAGAQCAEFSSVSNASIKQVWLAAAGTTQLLPAKQVAQAYHTMSRRRQPY
jgi:hypothetical protein